MPKATRLNDQSTGHDSCPPMPLVTGSGDVFINGRSAGRAGDLYAAHGCGAHSSHQDYISRGSGTVFINDRAAGRAGDAVVMAGSAAHGSPDVFIGG